MRKALKQFRATSPIPATPKSSRTNVQATPSSNYWGNHAVLRKLSSAPETASRVLYRKCAECEEEDSRTKVQAKRNEPQGRSISNDAGLPATMEASAGHAIENEMRGRLEAGFGHSFQDVRVHTDERADFAAASLQAEAFTAGRDIYFARDRYSPGTRQGQHLLAHEAAHVVQQSAGRTPAIAARHSDHLTVSAPHDPLEAEADRSADQFIQGSAAVISERQAIPARDRADVVQRQAKDAPAPCGPGTENPFCLPIPAPDAPCKPFASMDHGLSVWADLSSKIPLLTATATGCSEVKPVWETYFAATSTPFAFSSPASCVVAAAKVDPDGSDFAKRDSQSKLQDILNSLPATLRSVTLSSLPLGGPLAQLRLPLEDAIGPHGPFYLHPPIVYNNPFNAAANIAGAMGVSGQGSDIFGDDDRVIGGTVLIQVNAVDPTTGAMSGQVRWQPHIHVKDTVDFCPGNLGNSSQRQFTLPMSKLEAMGLTRDVPITIDYDLDTLQANFTGVMPLVGPQPSPGPGPKPPTPKPPAPSTFPQSGPAKTTGSLLRIRTGPGLQFPVLGLLGESGTPIQVTTQVHGDPVEGNDVWDQIDGGFVSDRFVTFL
jgi:hypothetical protein